MHVSDYLTAVQMQLTFVRSVIGRIDLAVAVQHHCKGISQPVCKNLDPTAEVWDTP
jgi:hypothetical protein